MRRTIRSLLIVSTALVSVAALWPADVSAQQRARPRAAPSQPAVPRQSYPARRPSYRPNYRPYYYGSYSYRPYYYGSYWPAWSLYGSFGRQWRYPYGYPYPYYPYYYDDRAELRIEVTPRDAQVYVDGYFAGLVDDFDGWAQRLHIEPGEHDVEIYMDGHRTRRERMLVRPRQSYTMRFALQPLGPGEAQEPRPAGGTPPSRVPPGSRAPERTPPPAGSPERAVPDRGIAVEREAPGTLNLRVQPADAMLWIDGERWEWPAGEDRIAIDLPEGSHRIEVQREGHRAYATTVTIKRGETTTLNVSLRRD